MKEERMTVVFINCSAVPFIDLIMSFQKLDETRTRNTLRAVTGRRVYFAETGHHRAPLCRCSAVIGDPLQVRSREEWESLRRRHCVPEGSRYDWTPETKVKYLYPLRDVAACDPFIPPEGVRHGYVYMEIE